MNIEYEATFYPINKNQMRLKLKKTGAKLIKKEFLMKRTVFNPPIPIKEGWLRVRNEGDKITMSLKVMKVKIPKKLKLFLNHLALTGKKPFSGQLMSFINVN